MLNKRFALPNRHFLRDFTLTIFGKHLSEKNQWFVWTTIKTTKSTSLLQKTVRWLDINQGHVVNLFSSVSTKNVHQFPCSPLIILRIRDFLRDKMFLYSETSPALLLTPSYGIKATASQSAEAQFVNNYLIETSKLICDFKWVFPGSHLTLHLQFAIVEENCVQSVTTYVWIEYLKKLLSNSSRDAIWRYVLDYVLTLSCCDAGWRRYYRRVFWVWWCMCAADLWYLTQPIKTTTLKGRRV